MNANTYKWLSMSYILTDGDKDILDADGLQFTLKIDQGAEIVLEEGLHNVPSVNPRAIFLYELGDGTNGTVIFKDNKAINASYNMQMTSSNYDYKNIHFDVQDNKNFEVDGEAYLPHQERDFADCTFAGGSATFNP